MSRSLKKYLSIFLAMILLCVNGICVLADEIQQAENKKAELSNAASQTRATLESLNAQKSELEKLIADLDKEMEDVSKELNSLIGKLNAKQEEIVKTKAELEVAKAKEEEQFVSMKARIQFMYENGSQSSILFQLAATESISELLNQAEYFFELSSYDRNMLNQYIEAKELVINTQNKLEEEKKELETAREAMEKKQGELALQTEQKTKQVDAFIENILQQQGALELIQGELAKTDNLLTNLIAAKQAEEAARKQREEEAAQAAASAAAKVQESKVSSQAPVETIHVSQPATPTIVAPPVSTKVPNAGYVRPTSGYISSYYGYRGYDATNGVGTAFHNGLDIAAPTGTPIVAAAAGTVVAATGTPMSDGRGNYVEIAHADGSSTIYMHMSSLGVSAGQYVEQGEYIGAVGSTGWSTGPHLHFGLNKGGGWIDPLPYLP